MLRLRMNMAWIISIQKLLNRESIHKGVSERRKNVLFSEIVFLHLECGKIHIFRRPKATKNKFNICCNHWFSSHIWYMATDDDDLDFGTCFSSQKTCGTMCLWIYSFRVRHSLIGVMQIPLSMFWCLSLTKHTGKSVMYNPFLARKLSSLYNFQQTGNSTNLEWVSSYRQNWQVCMYMYTCQVNSTNSHWHVLI